MLPLHRSPGRLADNVVHFARVLRDAGMPLGTDRVGVALQALQVAGLESRRDLHCVLAACLIDRAEHRALFDQAFELFWRDPDLMGRMRALLLPQVRLQPGALPAPPENRRLGDALFPHPPARPQQPPRDERTEIHAELSFNDRELLRKADFETMTAAEWRDAKRLIARLPLLIEPVRTRRWERSPRAASPDARASLAAMARQGGEWPAPRWRRVRALPPPLVVLADISGSMSRYSRMLLHLAHALARLDTPVESFVFGTRLTRITAALRHRDPDVAVAHCVRAVDDWSGGTRIHECLHQFNRRWARRVLPGRATVLLITDGLERDDAQALGGEMAQLKRQCRRLVWLNPLLRYDGFEPRAAGIRAMLPHVDQLLSAHNLQSLDALARLLAGAAEPASHPTASSRHEPLADPDPSREPDHRLAGPQRHQPAASRDSRL